MAIVDRTNNISVMYIRNFLAMHDNLDAECLDVGTLCTKANNKWSKYKPVKYATDLEITEIQRKEVNYGLIATKINRTTLDTIAWTYEKPTGGNYSPYRLLDYMGYNTDAKPFIRIDEVLWNPFTTSVDDLNFTPTYKFGPNSYDGNIQANSGQTLVGIEIYPQDLLAQLL